MGMHDLASTARAHALRAMAIATAALALSLLIVVFGPRFAGNYRPESAATRLGWILPVVGVSVLIVAFLPLERFGTKLAERLRLAADADGRFRNVAEEIGVAIGEAPDHIRIHPSPIANVGAFPTDDGTMVMATAGAVDIMTRDQLQALVAAQFAGAADPWCQRATRAELVWGLTIAFNFCLILLSPFSMMMAIIMMMVPRSIEAARDLCADVAAVQATRHPEALAGSMRRLRLAVPLATHFEIGGFRTMSAPFLVLTNRRESSTTVSKGNERSRHWTSADEVLVELALRADRAEALARGGAPAEYTGREYVRRWKQLGTSAGLTPDEQAYVELLAEHLGVKPTKFSSVAPVDPSAGAAP